jgi:hypothetical protein
MHPSTSVNQDRSSEHKSFTQENLVLLLGSATFEHPALSRIQVKLGDSMQSGIESRITSYDRMHHRHNRS